jgi:alpha-tubulin suppressor-like RCC1 family protein
MAGGVRFAAISAGDVHACGISLAGGAYCWGYDLYGQLGDASPQRPVSSTTPIPVVDANQEALPLTQVSAGQYHSCGLTAAGQAYCWGANGFGQLGNGSTSAPVVPPALPAITAPSVVAGGLAFTSIAAGGVHTCGLVPGGAAYCWGDNFSGQLGTGTLGGSSTTPTAVTGGLAFARIATGTDHTCGITVAGAAYCWGNNDSNRAGPINPANVAAPTAVSGGHTFAGITAGLRHSCGVVLAPAADVGTWCWGGNLYGALGNQLQAASRGVPVRAVPLQ